MMLMGEPIPVAAVTTTIHLMTIRLSDTQVTPRMAWAWNPSHRTRRWSVLDKIAHQMQQVAQDLAEDKMFDLMMATSEIRVF